MTKAPDYFNAVLFAQRENAAPAEMIFQFVI